MDKDNKSTELNNTDKKLYISDVSVSKIEVKTKVKLIRSVGRDEGMTHPNNVLSINFGRMLLRVAPNGIRV